MGVVPTRRLYGVLVCGGAIATVCASLLSTVGSGELTPTPLSSPGALGSIVLAMVAFDGVVLAGMVLDSLLVRPHRVQVTRQLPQRLSIGRDNSITLTLTPAPSENPRAAAVLIYDGYPQGIPPVAMPLRTQVMPPSRHPSHPQAPPATLTYRVHPQRRGRVQWQDIQVRQRGPLGLAWHSWRIPAAQTVSVYPDLIGLRSLTIRLALQATGSLRQFKPMGIGTEFAELREYGIGDDPRLIDWKATARRSHPLVRVLEPEREQTLMILLDRGRLMTAQVKGLSRFDWGLNAALALALAGLHRGDKVGIGVFDRTIHEWIPPAGGRTYLQPLIEKLTPMQPVLLESDYLGAVTQLATRQHRRSLVIVITDIVDATASAELLAALTRLKSRHLPFCVTLRDPQVDEQAHRFELNTPPQVSQAYSRAVALDLLAQRQMAFARLSQSGVLVLDAPANQIVDPLVDAYLRIKLTNRL